MNTKSPKSGSDDISISTPIVLFVFNRPDRTQKIFNRISRVEPNELLIIADGPRKNSPADENKCDAVRDIVTDIDWSCDLYTNFVDHNLGMKRRFQTGIEWVFDKVEEAIFLEDDCLPHMDFFSFCERILDEYRDDTRLMNITGTNFLTEWKSEQQDYHFSTHGAIWGWATWKDAWEAYDPEMEMWSDPDIRQRVADFICCDEQYYWRKSMYWKTFREEIETWDFQWGFARQVNSGLTVVPSRNLIKNIGFSEDATHTENPDLPHANLSTHKLTFPITRNKFVSPDREYDQRMFEMIAPRSVRVRAKIYKWLPSSFKCYM